MTNVSLNFLFRPFLIVGAIFFFIALFISLSTLLREHARLSHVEQVKASGKLRVLTRYGVTTYFEMGEEFAGFEYELVSRFAEWLGVKPVFIVPERFPELLAKILAGEADMAAAGLTITEVRSQYLRFSSPYQKVTEQLVYRDSQRRPRSVADLQNGILEVVAGSSHVDTLQRWRKKFPQLSWIANQSHSSEALMDLLNEGLIDYTVADSNQLAALRRFYPRLRPAFDLSAERALAWAFSKRHDGTLHQAAVVFLEELKQNKILDQLLERYYGHVERMEYADVCTFRKHFKERLPRYLAYFKEAAQQFDMDWRLLAAISYQESHWNVKALSPTGVRGLMMLTRKTAKQIHVADRLDPRESILGGTRYLVALKKKIPARIPEPDRTWFTLAAYNIGFGHLEDGRVLTQSLGGNPDKWMDVKKHLPLLAKKKWYQRTKHGYARGWEPVRYVENIRNYYDLLIWLTSKPKTRSLETKLSPPEKEKESSPIPTQTPAPI